MTMATHDETRTKLRELGYEALPASIRKFQTDYNKMGPARLIAVTGELDEETADAIDFAHGAGVMFQLARELRKGR